MTDTEYMKQALEQAKMALSRGEVPIGAVVVCGDRIIARAHNLVETLNDPTAHSEMQAITSATNALGGKYLDDCTMYVTLEPCPMCAAALYLSHIKRVVYAARDPKRGYTTISEKLLHPKTQVQQGVMEQECSEILTTFFQQKRTHR